MDLHASLGLRIDEETGEIGILDDVMSSSLNDRIPFGDIPGFILDKYLAGNYGQVIPSWEQLVDMGGFQNAAVTRLFGPVLEDILKVGIEEIWTINSGMHDEGAIAGVIKLFVSEATRLPPIQQSKFRFPISGYTIEKAAVFEMAGIRALLIQDNVDGHQFRSVYVCSIDNTKSDQIEKK